MIAFFRYVPLALVVDYLWAGWTIDDDMADTHHGRHSVLMRWTGDGEPTGAMQ